MHRDVICRGKLSHNNIMLLLHMFGCDVMFTNVRAAEDISLCNWINLNRNANSSQIIGIRGHCVFLTIEENVSQFHIHDQSGIFDMACLRGRSMANK